MKKDNKDWVRIRSTNTAHSRGSCAIGSNLPTGVELNNRRIARLERQKNSFKNRFMCFMMWVLCIIIGFVAVFVITVITDTGPQIIEPTTKERSQIWR
jgi:hypothetical protein